MSKESFLPPDNLTLRRIAREISPKELQSDYIQAEIDRTIAVAQGKQDQFSAQAVRGPLAGLAHIQIATEGDPLRLIVFDINATGKPNPTPPEFVTLINPVKVSHSSTIRQGRVSCFSVDERIAGYVPYPEEISVQTLDRYGNETIIHSDPTNPFQALLLDHEIQHLDGIIFVDHITDPQNIMLRDQDFPTYKTLWEQKRLDGPLNDYPHRGKKQHLYNLIMGKPYDANE